MPSDNAITPPPEAVQIIDQMFKAHAAEDHETCYRAASQILMNYSPDKIEEYSDSEALGLVFARAYEKSAEAGFLAIQRQFTDSANAFQEVTDLLKYVKWAEHLDDDPIFQEYRKLDLIARVQKPIMEASEASVRGSYSEAGLKMLMTEAYLPELRAILNKSAPETEHYMRETAFTLVSGYFMVGAMTHVHNATIGNKLLQAKMFFERIDMMLEEFYDVDIHDGRNAGFIAVMHAFADAARLRVVAEIAASEEDYDGAISQLTNSIIAFEQIAPIIPTDMPTGDVLREVVVNMGAIINQSIRHYSALQMMQSRLEAAKQTRFEMQDQIRDMDRKRDEIIKSFARQHMNVSIQNVNDIAAEIQINNEASVAMQNSGMDQVIQLLRQMPASEDAANLKKEAEKAKAEKDIAKKIEKVAAVIEGASKVADAASKLVPYGPAVMGALKGVFGLLPMLKRNAEAAAEDSLPETRLT